MCVCLCVCACVDSIVCFCFSVCFLPQERNSVPFQAVLVGRRRVQGRIPSRFLLTWLTHAPATRMFPECQRRFFSGTWFGMFRVRRSAIPLGLVWLSVCSCTFSRVCTTTSSSFASSRRRRPNSLASCLRRDCVCSCFFLLAFLLACWSCVGSGAGRWGVKAGRRAPSLVLCSTARGVSTCVPRWGYGV